MSGIRIEVLRKPFDRWMGPYSAARGLRHGLRFHGGDLGVWVNGGSGSNFWTVLSNSSVERLSKIGRAHV